MPVRRARDGSSSSGRCRRPYHGVTVSTDLVLANPLLRERFARSSTSTRATAARSARSAAGTSPTSVSGSCTPRACCDSPAAPRGRLPAALAGARPVSPRLALRSTWPARGAGRSWHTSGVASSGRRSTSARARWSVRTFGSRSGGSSSLAVMGESLRGVFDGLVADERIAVVSNGTPAPTGAAGMQRDPWRVLFRQQPPCPQGLVRGGRRLRCSCWRRSRERRFVFVGNWEDAEFERSVRARAGERARRSDRVSRRASPDLTRSV